MTYAVVSAVLLFVITRKIRNSSDPEYLKPYVQTRQYLIDTGAVVEDTEPAAEDLGEVTEDAVSGNEPGSPDDPADPEADPDKETETE